MKKTAFGLLFFLSFSMLATAWNCGCAFAETPAVKKTQNASCHEQDPVTKKHPACCSQCHIEKKAALPDKTDLRAVAISNSLERFVASKNLQANTTGANFSLFETCFRSLFQPSVPFSVSIPVYLQNQTLLL